MSEGHASAERILNNMRSEHSAIERSQRDFMDSVGHPADRDQGRGLDPVEHRRGLFSPIVDGFAYCVIRMAQALMEDEPPKLKAKPLPDLEHREASSWFSGWWHGICVGAVVGVGVATVLFTSGVL